MCEEDGKSEKVRIKNTKRKRGNERDEKSEKVRIKNTGRKRGKERDR